MLQRRKQNLKALGKLYVPTFISATASFAFHRNIQIGKYCRIGKENRIDGEGGVIIGDGCMLAPRVTILSSSHNYLESEMLPYDDEDLRAPVVIGRGVWIGWGATILPGVTVADGSIVGAGAVVSRNVEKGEIVAGNPARVIKVRDNAGQVDDLVRSEKYYLKEVLEGRKSRKGRNFTGEEVIWKIK
jgi:acetyltransferase-like isoleucine patch superfamily enzyme